ncbi:hypothetical protein DL546_006148 [Coniochaeta pulveracea]|uniref:Uncharacterized protein n=1 Tax=Coniochaeta pulveracea TaxID=177199 RepID=A0A420YNL8_9PEZI|nr:hypothetical protein DL546_006148 [Coniochaeta pulveracea]
MANEPITSTGCGCSAWDYGTEQAQYETCPACAGSPRLVSSCLRCGGYGVVLHCQHAQAPARQAVYTGHSSSSDETNPRGSDGKTRAHR